MKRPDRPHTRQRADRVRERERERHDQAPVAADDEWEEAGHASHQKENRETEGTD